ncbi:MAG: dihydrofolate reductase family protein [Myxococcales bacterium]|nr:dihydrofolate reductase family protein [Myxococcales bacterium]
MATRVRAFLAMSLDGFIAGEDDDLSWLPTPDPAEDHGYGAFMATVGALLIGRRTLDVVLGFPDPWPYGARPVLVATHRPLPAVPATVRAVAGAIGALVEQARAVAAGGDVYLDGGELVRQALAADVLDELTVTVVPVVLGGGRPLFARGAPRPLQLARSQAYASGLVQLCYQTRAA